uniref:Uncharacterized protein n=1 Tax=Globodera rostochiensis TaxID=31243 RepID=A0A914GZY9_GLORO
MKVGVASSHFLAIGRPSSGRLPPPPSRRCFKGLRKNSGGTFLQTLAKAIAVKASTIPKNSNLLTIPIPTKANNLFEFNGLKRFINRLTNNHPNMLQKTVFCSFSSTTNAEAMPLTQPSSSCLPLQCRRPSSASCSLYLNLLSLALLLIPILSMLLMTSPAACSSAPSLPIPSQSFDFASFGDLLPEQQQQPSTSSPSSSEETVRKSATEKAEEWEKEEAKKLKKVQNQQKKNIHRVTVKRQMKRAVASEVLEEEEREKAAEEEAQTCTVRVQVVKKVKGKCVRLHGGQSACQSADYLDPVNEDCMFA